MQYTYWSHLYLTAVGLLLLVILVFTLRSEMSFLAGHRKGRMQFFLSLVSIFVILALTVICLFHWMVHPVFTFTAILLLFPVLLVLAPVILLLRAKEFAELAKTRREEQNRLIREVQELIEEKKRQKAERREEPRREG